MGATCQKSTAVQPSRTTGSGRWKPHREGNSPPTDVINDPKLEQAVTKVDLRIADNSKAHQTNKYDVVKSLTASKLVVRRGQPFLVDVEFSQEINADANSIRIVCEAGNRPLVSKGTSVNMIVSTGIKAKEWGAKLEQKDGKKLTISIQTPPTCYVGKWRLYVDVIGKANNKEKRFKVDDPVYVIFNPWCKDDTVYLDNSNLLYDYVLNEIGKLYVGSYNNITSRPWNFGQFESCVLDAAMYLMDVSKLKWEARGDPVHIVRAISAMVNANDDNGVIIGRWSSDYSDGHPPTFWTGSPAIIEEFWKTKEPVKYGQCWVFSGVTTTISRALGIPTRSVTNYQSAHDTDGSITIDVHFNKDGSLDNNVDNDTIWNFHVWNEAWMSRPDLSAGYGGWQAFDATPQETSNGVFCCGPVSVAAIRQGAVNEPYDGPFVFAEVNGDRVHWAPDAQGNQIVAGIEIDVVGKNISTKAANSGEREDITNNYKPPEGSPEERTAVLRANQLISNRRSIYKEQSHDVAFTFDTSNNDTYIGGNIELSLKMKNNGNSIRTVGGQVEVKSMYYTGVLADLIKALSMQGIVMNPGQEASFPVPVNFSDYDGKLRDIYMLDITVMAMVKETNQTFVKKDSYRLKKPHLTITGPSKANLGQEFTAHISFTNPLNKVLTKCKLVVDGVCPSKTIEISKVPAKNEMTSTVYISPSKVGNTELIAVFHSKELEDIDGSMPIVVNEV